MRALRRFGPVGFLMILLMALLACRANKAATAKCKTDPDCEACCKANGATGHASGTVNGVYSCKCTGG